MRNPANLTQMGYGLPVVSPMSEYLAVRYVIIDGANELE